MRTHGPRFLAALRRWRHSVAAALLPAVLVSALSGIACPAMSAPAAVAPEHAHHAAHAWPAGSHSSHANHEHPGTAPTLPQGDCPHCLGGDAAANLGAATCAAGVTATVSSAPPSVPLALPIAGELRASPAAAPPLIRSGSPPDEPSAAAVPLRLLHCVLLI